MHIFGVFRYKKHFLKNYIIFNYVYVCEYVHMSLVAHGGQSCWIARKELQVL